MKQLLLTVFLFTAGMISTEKVNAQKESKTTHLPKNVMDEFESIRSNDEAWGFTYTNVIWTKIKNVFTVTFVATHPDMGTGVAKASWNAKGERIE